MHPALAPREKHGRQGGVGLLLFGPQESLCFVPQEQESQRKEPSRTSEEDNCEKREQVAQQAFVFGQNLRDRVKVRGQLGALGLRRGAVQCLEGPCRAWRLQGRPPSGP